MANIKCSTCHGDCEVLNDIEKVEKLSNSPDGRVILVSHIGGIDICPDCQNRSEIEWNMRE